jgi:signal transduction histidine kinase/ActR/RegA family two-component response regulator
MTVVSHFTINRFWVLRGKSPQETILMEGKMLRETPAEGRSSSSQPREAEATFEEIDRSTELASRPYRGPNYDAEHRALALLATEMAENPRNMLQKLADMAIGLCRADSAGISILEGDVFRWESVAGAFASLRNNTMPRDASPCGVCIDQNATQLMYLADRRFPALVAEPRVIEALLVPFQHHGKPVGTVWIVAHNEERKFDKEDERIVRTLARFASAGWQLWKAYSTEAESSRKKNEFLAMLGHELRNPLAAIVNANDLLQNLGIVDRRGMRAIGVIARQSQHLGSMVNDLIDLTRITFGKLQLRRERIKLQAVVNQAVETTRGQIESHQHRLSISVPKSPIRLDADPVRLTQMLSNLLDNAAKYTPKGGEISIATELADEHVCITVRDNGIGIPEDQIERIFDLFSQFDGPDTAASKSLGMGLALVRKLAELHSGSVDVISWGPGKGSVFTIRLPVLQGPSCSDKAETTMERSVDSTADRRILIVEDNDDVAESLGELLGLDGHVVSAARDGTTALGMLETFDPDIVLLDIGLPGMDGYQVARRMRIEKQKSDLVIVAMSGYGEEKHRRSSMEVGCDFHLVKPVMPDVLRDLVNSIGMTQDRPAKAHQNASNKSGFLP